MQLKARPAHRDPLLKFPGVLQDKGPALPLVLVANHVGWVGGGNLDHLGFRVIVEQFGGESRLHGILFFHFIILAAFRNAPRLEIGQASLFVEGDGDIAKFSALGAQDLDRPAVSRFDVAIAGDGGDLLAEEHHRLGVVRIPRQRRLGRSAEPVWRGGGNERGAGHVIGRHNERICSSGCCPIARTKRFEKPFGLHRPASQRLRIRAVERNTRPGSDPAAERSDAGHGPLCPDYPRSANNCRTPCCCSWRPARFRLALFWEAAE